MNYSIPAITPVNSLNVPQGVDPSEVSGSQNSPKIGEISGRIQQSSEPDTRLNIPENLTPDTKLTDREKDLVCKSGEETSAEAGPMPEISRSEAPHDQESPKIGEISGRIQQNSEPDTRLNIPENLIPDTKLTDRESRLTSANAMFASGAGAFLGLGLIGGIVKNFDSIKSTASNVGCGALNVGRSAISAIAAKTGIASSAKSIALGAVHHPYIAAGCAIGCIALGIATYYLAKHISRKNHTEENIEQLANNFDANFFATLISRQLSVNQAPRTPPVDYEVGGNPLRGFLCESSSSASPSASASDSFTEITETRPENVGRDSPDKKVKNTNPKHSSKKAEGVSMIPRQAPRRIASQSAKH
jgi:hypothetical protein